MDIKKYLYKLNNKFFFPIKSFKEGSFLEKIHHATFYMPYFPSKNKVDENTYQEFNKASQTWELLEFAYQLKERCTIEPGWGWAIHKDSLIKESLYNVFVHLNNGLNKPFYPKYKLGYKKSRTFEKTIPLHYGAGNYWHFYNDLLGNLALLEELNIDISNYHIIVPSKLKNYAFFTYFLQKSEKLRGLNWIYQEPDELIYSENSIFLNTFWGRHKNFNNAKNFLCLNRPKVIGDKKVFITRNLKRIRSIINLNEIHDICQQFNFEIYDLDLLNVEEQIELFENSSQIIAIHGAALTNLIYCSPHSSIKILEILPQDYQNPCYFWLATEMNMDYWAINGSPMDPLNKKHFYLDPTLFKEKILAFTN